MLIYQVVDNDEYELPVAQFETATDCAKWLGMNNNKDVHLYIRSGKPYKKIYKIVKINV